MMILLLFDTKNFIPILSITPGNNLVPSLGYHVFRSNSLAKVRDEKFPISKARFQQEDSISIGRPIRHTTQKESLLHLDHVNAAPASAPH